MEVGTAITLLTINLIVLSVVIVLLLVVVIILVVKLNKIAGNVQQTTSNIASITEWFSPVKLFSEVAKVFTSFKKR
jgi:ABC-type cobalt transport system substrate-binding protein